jgi:large subunit ribosomal protein L5
MKKNLQIYYNSIIIYDLISKLPRIKNQFQIPKITAIHINIGLKTITTEKQKIISMLTLLKIITNQEPILTKSKKNNIFLKIKKNSIIGCKVTLHKSLIYDFLEKLLFSVSFSILNINKKSLTLTIPNKYLLNFFELKTEFFSFQNLPSIDIIIQTNTIFKKEFILLLNLFSFKKKRK